MPSVRARPSALARPVFRTFLAGALILALCLLAYLPAIQGKFLWDDLYLVGANPFFRSPRFVLEVFRHWLFVDSFSLYYRPVQNVSYMVDYLVWNNQEFGYHLSNILFHAASAFLLFLVLRRCLKALPTGGPLRFLAKPPLSPSGCCGRCIPFITPPSPTWPGGRTASP